MSLIKKHNTNIIDNIKLWGLRKGHFYLYYADLKQGKEHKFQVYTQSYLGNTGTYVDTDIIEMSIGTGFQVKLYNFLPLATFFEIIEYGWYKEE